jgi:hypothetical protein
LRARSSLRREVTDSGCGTFLETFDWVSAF